MPTLSVQGRIHSASDMNYRRPDYSENTYFFEKSYEYRS